MSHHDRIDQIVESHLTEAKKRIDIGFEYIGKSTGKAKITYINPKAKNLPHWAQVGKEIKSDMLGTFEVEYGAEVYNLDGRTVKNGYVIESEEVNEETKQVTKLYTVIDKHMKNMMKEIGRSVDLSDLEGTDGWGQVQDAFTLVIRKHLDDFGVEM